MRRLLILLLFALSLPTSQVLAAEASTYYIPPAQLTTALQIMDMGFSNIIALFRSSTGSFNFDDSNKSLSNLRIAVDATSVMTTTTESQRDLANLLGAFQFSEIRIVAPDTAIFVDNKVDVKANVTLHGVTKPVTFEAVLNKAAKSTRAGGMWSNEGEAVGISLRGTLKRADFGMVDTPANAETPSRFGDTITLMLEMQAIKQ